MMRRVFLLGLSVLVGSCGLVSNDCLYDEVGCNLPGDWRLVSINGEAAVGQWEIAEGFVDRSGYGVLPTGHAAIPEMRGPFESNYSLDPDRPQGFDLQFWSMSTPSGTFYVDVYGRIASLDSDRMEYVVQRVDADLPFPTLAPGTRLVFER